MAPSPELRERAEFCRRLARHCTDPDRRDSLMKLAEEFRRPGRRPGKRLNRGLSAGPDEQGAD